LEEQSMLSVMPERLWHHARTVCTTGYARQVFFISAQLEMGMPSIKQLLYAR